MKYLLPIISFFNKGVFPLSGSVPAKTLFPRLPCSKEWPCDMILTNGMELGDSLGFWRKFTLQT